MYRVKLSEVYALNSCRTDWQVGDSYCAWSKLACSALNTRLITTSPCFSEGLGEMSPEVCKFFSALRKVIGSEKFEDVININDCKQGRFTENHERALKLALQLALESGVVELVEENNEFVLELREKLNAQRSNAGIPA